MHHMCRRTRRAASAATESHLPHKQRRMHGAPRDSGRSDAGISAALRAGSLSRRPRSPSWWPTPTRTFPSAGSPTTSRRSHPLGQPGHRTIADLEATGWGCAGHGRHRIDVEGRKLLVSGPSGDEELLSYDELVVGTGRCPCARPSTALGPDAVAPTTASTCSTPWVTLSRSCARSRSAAGQCPDRRAGTSAWKWPRHW